MALHTHDITLSESHRGLDVALSMLCSRRRRVSLGCAGGVLAMVGSQCQGCCSRWPSPLALLTPPPVPVCHSHSAQCTRGSLASRIRIELRTSPIMQHWTHYVRMRHAQSVHSQEASPGCCDCPADVGRLAAGRRAAPSGTTPEPCAGTARLLAAGSDHPDSLASSRSRRLRCSMRLACRPGCSACVRSSGTDA